MGMKERTVEVLVSHPHGERWVPLGEWIRVGPGPRPLLGPTAARLAGSNKGLPLRVIPLRYRNTALSRLLISVGLLRDPWGR